MGTRVFARYRNTELVSDERDIMVSSQLINHVIAWCDLTGVTAEQVDTSPLIQWACGVNLWRVRDEQQRTMFALRWA